MNKLFSFFTKGESHQIIRIAAKVLRVIYIILAFVAAVYILILGSGALTGFFNIGEFVLGLLFGAFLFVIIMLIGMFVEAMLIGFANIIENQFEELVLKNKAEEQPLNFGIGKKDNANFEKIKKLSELKEAGAISEEEFDAKKKEYMEKI